MIATNLTKNYLGVALPQTPDSTNTVSGSRGQTVTGKKGVNNDIFSGGGGSTLIGGGASDTFFVVDPDDKIVVAPGTGGINTVVVWTSFYQLPDNVQNMIAQSASGTVGVGNAMDNLMVAQGSSNYTLNGGAGNDVLVGNGSGDPSDTGGSTSFVIQKGEGNDVIANFHNGVDTVKLMGFNNFTSLATVKAAMSQVGGNVVLNLGDGSTLTFDNETIGAFSSRDFLLSASLPNMTLRFNSDFNNFTWSPDGKVGWMTTGGSGDRTLPSNHEAEYYSDSTVGVNPFSVSNGVLKITASPGTNPYGLPYNSGMITTEGSFGAQYGLFEVTAKMPAGAGLWPAVWLLPTSLAWPPEIDIMEGLQDDPASIYVGTHSAVGGPNVGTTTKVYVGDTTTSFNTYAVDWEPDRITWFYNGNVLFSEATPADMHQPMYLLINLAVGGAGSWPGTPDANTKFPAEMLISSVQFYASANTTHVTGPAALAPSGAVTIVGDTPSSGPVVTPPAVDPPVVTPPVVTPPVVDPPVVTPPVVTPDPVSVTSVTTSPGNGALRSGGTVTITVNFSGAVTVAGGTPTLALNDGASARYLSGSGTNALVFTYTVAAGQNTADLALAASNAIGLGGATIKDGSGNAAVLTGANGANPAGILQIDTTRPTVTSVTTSPGNGSVGTGGTVALTVNFSSAVNVAGGKPTLTLNNGAVATYQSGSGTGALVFSYTVAAGQDTADLALAATRAISLAGATIRDAAGNSATLSGANGANPAGTLRIDTTLPPVVTPPAQDPPVVTPPVVPPPAQDPPVVSQPVVTPPAGALDASVTSVSASPVSGDLSVGAIVALTVHFNAAVTVARGAPTLNLNDGGKAYYQSGSGTDALVFLYTVGAGQNTPDLALAASNAIALGDSIVVGTSGGSVDLSGANGLNPAGTLKIDTTQPAAQPAGATNVTLSGWGQQYSGADGSYAITGSAGGSKVSLGNGNETVNVTGINNTLTTGSGNETITYTGTGNVITTGSGTNSITVTGSYAQISVVAPKAGTTRIIAAGSSENITSTGTGNISISGPTGNSHVTLGDGDNTVVLGGSGNTVTVGVGTSTIVSGNESGHTTVHAGGGAATITVTGWNNVLDAGPGMNFLNGGTGSDTFYLNGPGQGLDTITGFSPEIHDVLNLSRTLALATTAVDLTNVGNFISATAAGGDTTLYVDVTGGHGTPAAFAVLKGVTTTVATLVANNDLKLTP